MILDLLCLLQSHTTGVRSREDIEEAEEEKRLAEEERKFKENLRQKVGEWRVVAEAQD